MIGSWHSTSIILITFSVLFIFVFNFGDIYAVPTEHLCRPEQRDALLELKELGVDKKYIYSGNTDYWDNNSDCCHWEGIICDAKSGDVTELHIGSSSLHGQIPSSIGNLSHLTYLVLSYNYFDGKIPSSIVNLSHLTSLDLSNNHFSGQILSWIENLSHLTYLGLSNNHFSGKIPSSIGNLSHLTSPHLSYNNFSGKIPSSIGVLKGLTVLTLSNNRFEGHIPSTIANLTQLQSLVLSRNMLFGKIPPQLGGLLFLEFVDFSSNKFVGIIPRSTQFQTQNPLSFQDNVGLCGPPPEECRVIPELSASQQPEEEEVLSWIAVVIGVGPGIVFGFRLTLGDRVKNILKKVRLFSPDFYFLCYFFLSISSLFLLVFLLWFFLLRK